MQLSKLMTYFQRISWQSKRQIADIRLLCSQVRFGSLAVIRSRRHTPTVSIKPKVYSSAAIIAAAVRTEFHIVHRVK